MGTLDRNIIYNRYGFDVIVMYHRCDNRCSFCFVTCNKLVENNTRFEQQVLLALKRAKRRGARSVCFFGGEITLCPSLPRMIRFASNIGLFVYLDTHGRRFAKLQYCRQFSGVSFAQIKVSLHADLPDLHDQITKKRGSFLETVSGIENIIKSRFPLSVAVVITNINFSRLRRIVAFVYSKGVRRVKFLALLGAGELLKHPELVPSLRKIRPYLDKAILFCQKKRVEVCVSRVPYCLLPQHVSLFEHCTYDIPYFQHISACYSCDWYGCCNGIDRLTLQLHPRDVRELRPQRILSGALNGKVI